MLQRLVIIGALVLTACGGGGPKQLGERCKLDASSPCDEGLVCAETIDADMDVVGRCFLPEGALCDGAAEESFCSPALRCAERTDATFACHIPLEVRGQVRDAGDATPVVGAHIIALDPTPVAVSDVSVSGIDGNYVLDLPTVRNLDGSPTIASYTLRASGDGYQTFPGGIRQALPISTADAVQMPDAWVLEGSVTDILLLPLEEDVPRTTISGAVVAEGQEAGVLVVAEAGSAGLTAISDASGQYTIFNVTPGDYTVRGFFADLQLTPVTVTVAGIPLTAVDLVATADPPLGTVNGTLQIVNAPGGSVTTVVLAVESTFNEALGRGEIPSGLRAPREGAPSVTGDWSIQGVPAGRYVVLAGFENDALVRDPDQLIGGTGIVHVEVPGAAGPVVDVTDSFKVTAALTVFDPGEELPELVTAAPMLTWADDSSEEEYDVRVFDAYGNIAWEETIDGVSGSAQVMRMYGGPMDAGMYYQFRAISFRMVGGRRTAISATEDLRGVFFVP